MKLLVVLGQLSALAGRRGNERAYSTGAMNIFDRETKRKQKNRASLAAKEDRTYDYLKDKVTQKVAVYSLLPS